MKSFKNPVILYVCHELIAFSADTFNVPLSFHTPNEGYILDPDIISPVAG